MENELKKFVSKDEKIIWEGKPDKRCFKHEMIFNPLLPSVIVWITIDICLIVFCLINNTRIPRAFLTIFSFPIWIYFGKLIFSGREYRNKYYIITNMGVYSSRGTFSKKCKFDPYAEISNITTYQSTSDKKFNVGDIILEFPEVQKSNSPKVVVEWGKNANLTKTIISDIPNYQEIYNLMLKAQNEVRNAAIYSNNEYKTMINSTRRYLE